MTTAVIPEQTAAWFVATWVDVAPLVPFTLTELHDALDHVCGRTEVSRIVNDLIRFGLIVPKGREWVATRRLLDLEEDRTPDQGVTPDTSVTPDQGDTPGVTTASPHP
jgi:hypothetical protein